MKISVKEVAGSTFMNTIHIPIRTITGMENTTKILHFHVKVTSL